MPDREPRESRDVLGEVVRDIRHEFVGGIERPWDQEPAIIREACLTLSDYAIARLAEAGYRIVGKEGTTT